MVAMQLFGKGQLCQDLEVLLQCRARSKFARLWSSTTNGGALNEAKMWRTKVNIDRYSFPHKFRMMLGSSTPRPSRSHLGNKIFAQLCRFGLMTEAASEA